MIVDYSSRPPVEALSRPARHLENYRNIYATAEQESSQDVGPEALAKYLAAYDAIGADHVVLKARDLETTFGVKVSNEDVAAFCMEYGPRFVGLAGVDPHKGMQAVRELEYAVRELGLRGLNLQCFEHKLHINDPKMYPLYAKCIELGVPVNIHCGINFSTESLMDYGRPILLDHVMTHFPELKVCAAPPTPATSRCCNTATRCCRTGFCSAPASHPFRWNGPWPRSRRCPCPMQSGGSGWVKMRLAC
jgi:uncharacterized protein